MTSKDFLIITILLGTCLTACQATPGKSTASSAGGDQEAVSPSYSFPYGMAITVPPANGVPTLYAIIIADTRDSEIGKSTQADLDHIKTLVNNISKHTQLPNHTLIIQGEQLSRQAVVNLLTQLSITGQDMVIFYYSGHGTRGRQAEQRESRWPYLCVEGGGRCSVKDNRLDLDEVVDSLRQKGPRFFMVMADACNDLIRGRGDKNWFTGTSKPDNYRQLFLEPSGYHIIASGSKAGQVSIGEEFGGKFTNQLLNVLYQQLAADYPASWETIMQRAVEPIPYQDREGEKIQQPQFDFLPHNVASLSSPTSPQSMTPEEPTKPSPPVSLGEIHLEISPSNRLRPGDAVQLAITSAQGGYLFVFDAENKDGGALSPVFPNPVYQERSGKQYFQLLADKKFLLPDERYFDLEAKLRAPQEVGPRSLVALLVKTDRDLEKVRQLSNQPVSSLTDWLNQNLQKEQWVMTTITYEITQ